MTIGDVFSGASQWCVLHADCLAVLPTIPTDMRPIICADPPYGFGKYPTDKDVTLAMLRAAEGWRTLTLKGYAQSLYQWLRLAGVSEIAEWITWTPTNYAAKAGGRWRGLPRWSEHFAVCGHVPGAQRLTRARNTHSVADAISERHKGADWDPRGPARQGDWWNDPAPGIAFQSHRRLHPNETAIEVMLKLIELISDPGDLVVDPFCGSGTAGVAAVRLGRRYLGMDIAPEWAELSRERIEAEGNGSTLAAARAGQTTLFGVGT